MADIIDAHSNRLRYRRTPWFSGTNRQLPSFRHWARTLPKSIAQAIKSVAVFAGWADAPFPSTLVEKARAQTPPKTPFGPMRETPLWKQALMEMGVMNRPATNQATPQEILNEPLGVILFEKQPPGRFEEIRIGQTIDHGRLIATIPQALNLIRDEYQQRKATGFIQLEGSTAFKQEVADRVNAAPHRWPMIAIVGTPHESAANEPVVTAKILPEVIIACSAPMSDLQKQEARIADIMETYRDATAEAAQLRAMGRDDDARLKRNEARWLRTQCRRAAARLELMQDAAAAPRNIAPVRQAAAEAKAKDYSRPKRVKENAAQIRAKEILAPVAAEEKSIEALQRASLRALKEAAVARKQGRAEEAEAARLRSEELLQMAAQARVTAAANRQSLRNKLRAVGRTTIKRELKSRRDEAVSAVIDIGVEREQRKPPVFKPRQHAPLRLAAQ